MGTITFTAFPNLTVPIRSAQFLRRPPSLPAVFAEASNFKAARLRSWRQRGG